MAGCATTGSQEPTASALDGVIAGSQRTAADRGRDVYRHPKQTLLFFGMRPQHAGIAGLAGAGLVHGDHRAAAAGPGAATIAAVIAPDPGSRFLEARLTAYRGLSPRGRISTAARG